MAELPDPLAEGELVKPEIARHLAFSGAGAIMISATKVCF